MTVILKKVRDENKYYPFFVGLRAPIFLLIRSFGGLHFPISYRFRNTPPPTLNVQVSKGIQKDLHNRLQCCS